MKTWFAFCLFGIISTSLLLGQLTAHSFQTKALGANIGTINVTKRIAGDSIFYTNNTLLEVNLLIKRIRLEVENRAYYYRGQLMRATNRVIVNGDLNTSSEIQWDGNQYSIKLDGEVKPSFDKPIFFSGSMLYHEEPINQAQAFSESSGVFMPIKSLGEGAYRVTDPINNRDMIRYYEEGSLVLTKIKHPVLTIYMRLINENENEN